MKEKLLSVLRIYQNKNHRTALFASFTSIRNVAYSLGMFVLGLLNWSSFLLVNGSYQLALSLIRILNIISYSKSQHGHQFNRERMVPITGALIIALGIAYFFINFHFYMTRPEEHFSLLSSLITATLAFVKMGSSIWGFLSNRKSKDPEVVSIRLLSLVDATVSIVTTQRVLLTMEEGSAVAANSTPLFGMTVSGCFVLTGLYMMVKKQTR